MKTSNWLWINNGNGWEKVKVVPGNTTEWLDIIWKGKMVQINGKGRIRPERRKRK